MEPTPEPTPLEATPTQSRNPVRTPRAWLWTAALFLAFFLLLFPALWAFQLARSLRYEIVREHTAFDCPTCADGKLWAFAGFPQAADEGVQRGAAADAPATDPGRSGSQPPGSKRILSRTWCHDFMEKSGGKGVLRIGEKSFSVDCAGGAPALPGRFVYFVFLSNLDDASWNNAGLRPNLILFNWADPAGYLLRTFPFADLILALAASAFLAFACRYLARHYRAIFALGSVFVGEGFVGKDLVRKPGKRFWIAWGLSCAMASIAYFFSLFHNIVLLYFSWVALGFLAFRRLFLIAGETAPSPSAAGPLAKLPVKPRHWILLVALSGVAFALRAYKSDWGFPLLLHTDEYAITSFPPRMAESNSLDPIDFERPNHASIYLNSVAYGIASQARFHAPPARTFAGHELFYHRLSRLMVAALGVACLWVAFLIGAEFHPGFGLFAAALFALFPQFVEHSHYVTPDISLTLCLLGVVLFSLRYMRSPNPANLLYACACAALATAEKYPGVLSLSALAAAIFLVERGDRDRLLLISARALIGFTAFLFLAAPFLFLKPHMVLLNLISESRPTHPGHDGLGFLGNADFYLHAYGASTSLLLAAFAAVGAYLLIKQRGRTAAPLALGLFYWLILSELPLHWERWDLPMVITPLFCAAYGMHALWEKRAVAGAWATAGLVLAMAAAGTNLLLKSLVVLADLRAKDTCLLGLEQLPRLGINEGNTLVGHYTPLSPTWKRGFDFVADYRDAGIMKDKSFAMVSSNLYDRYFNEPEKYPAEVRFYSSLFSLPLVLDVKPEPMAERFSAFFDLANLARAYPAWQGYQAHGGGYSSGPEIRVYRLTPDGGPPRVVREGRVPAGASAAKERG